MVIRSYSRVAELDRNHFLFNLFFKFSPVGVTRSQWRGGHRADGPALPARSSSGPCEIFWSFFLHFLKSKFASYLGSDFQHFCTQYGPQMDTSLCNTQVPSIPQMRNPWNSFFCVWLIMQIDGGERDVDIIWLPNNFKQNADFGKRANVRLETHNEPIEVGRL